MTRRLLTWTPDSNIKIYQGKVLQQLLTETEVDSLLEGFGFTKENLSDSSINEGIVYKATNNVAPIYFLPDTEVPKLTGVIPDFSELNEVYQNIRSLLYKRRYLVDHVLQVRLSNYLEYDLDVDVTITPVIYPSYVKITNIQWNISNEEILEIQDRGSTLKFRTTGIGKVYISVVVNGVPSSNTLVVSIGEVAYRRFTVKSGDRYSGFITSNNERFFVVNTEGSNVGDNNDELEQQIDDLVYKDLKFYMLDQKFDNTVIDLSLLFFTSNQDFYNTQSDINGRSVSLNSTLMRITFDDKSVVHLDTNPGVYIEEGVMITDDQHLISKRPIKNIYFYNEDRN